MRHRLLQNDAELAEAEKLMRFVEVDRLSDKSSLQLWIISFFTEQYANTDQETVLFSAELCVVVRNVLEGRVPLKLIWLSAHDFLPELSTIVDIDLVELAEQEDARIPSENEQSAS